MTKILQWRNYLLFYLAAISIINLFLLRLPLANVFGYEFSVVNSLLLVLFSGIYSVYFLKSFTPKESIDVSKELFCSLSFFLLLPFCISIINSIIHGFCSFWDGLLFYIVITLPSILIGAALGAGSVFLMNRFHVVLVLILYIGILFIIAFEIYFNPQVYVYNPILGFFPGTIYDEGIEFTAKLILYRICNTIFFGFVFFVSVRQLYNKKRKSALLIVFISLLTAGVFYFLSPFLGYSTTAGSLTKALGKTIKTKNFIIHYDKRLDNNKMKMLALNHEYYYYVLKEFFETETDDKIVSYIFYDNDQKKELFGSKYADVAKPWLNQIYIAYDNWEHTLKHELAHCFSATFGAGIFKLASGWNPLLIEGIAEAADGNYNDNDIHHMAALAYNSDYKVDLQYLLTKTGFFTSPSSISYIYAGSFVKYLVENYGIKVFKDFYLNGYYKISYEIELNNTLESYYSFLTDFDDSKTLDMAHYYFGRKSLLQKTCPRAISSYLSAGWEQLRSSDILGARGTFETVVNLADNYSALVGLARSYEKQDSLMRAITLLRDDINKFEGTSYFYNLELILADLYLKREDLQKADSLYTRLIEQFPNRKLYFLAKIRRELLKDEKMLTNYLNGSNYDKYSILLILNEKNYNYYSFPTLIRLSNTVEEAYNLFLDRLDKDIIVEDFASSYASFILSKYMLINYDFTNARKMSGLSLRYNSDDNFNTIKKQHFQKVEWFYQNADRLLRTFEQSKNH
ncbi:MAG: hypothetical protein JSW63_11595 [Ignavibacterium sp.]|nr:MAG: hypothetical protein JSW63_11595 [Ignavibacterium sp.]